MDYRILHTIYIWSLVLIVLATTVYIAYTGYSYYILPIEERFYHPRYHWFKPSGLFGQGLGVIGTCMIAFGVGIYIARKRYGFMKKLIRLKYLLEFHIFLCTLGPILILFHTTFKFGGIVSIAFWSMVAVVLSGVVGRFIYIQIPRGKDGEELSNEEIESIRKSFSSEIGSNDDINTKTTSLLQEVKKEQKWGIKTYFRNKQLVRQIRASLNNSTLNEEQKRELILKVQKELALASKVGRLERMKSLFNLWHVVHMPFAIIMLIIVLIHVGVTVALGYKWIF